ncbi:MAG: hypothetical protein L3J99_06245 [Thermoplasmata archaeon]|nr:hypothetical protein [Thermoplasmata archaeon]
MNGPKRSSRSNVLFGVAVVSIVLALIGAGLSFHFTSSTLLQPSCAGGGLATLDVLNETGVIRSSFSPGGIQTLGANGSTALLGGVGFYERQGPSYATVPALAAWPLDGASAVNLTALIAPYFPRGGLYPVVWNGTAWLIAGQVNASSNTGPALVFLHGNRVVDRTSTVASYFHLGWIWTAGWDGQGWLVAGNATSGAAAVYLAGGRVTDLTPLLPHDHPGDWIQWVGWNGSSWLLGGGGMFASFRAGAMTDLLPGSPFVNGGVYGGAWNGTRWLVGGQPDSLAYVDGNVVHEGPSLPGPSSGWVNAVVVVPGGWLAGGGIVLGPDQVRPQLDFVPGLASLPVSDLSYRLPSSFNGGWIQFGAAVRSSAVELVLLGGVGGSDPVKGPGYGALAGVTWSCASLGFRLASPP